MRCQEIFLPQTQWLRQKDDSIHIFGRSASHGSPFGLCLQSPYSALAVQKNLLQLQCVESVKPEAVLSLYGRCAQRSLSYYITHPVHFPACVSQRDGMPRLVHQHNFILPSEGVEGSSISKPRHCLMEIGSGLVTDFTQALRKQPMEYANCSLIRDQFPQGIPVFRVPGSTAHGAVQKLMIQKRKSRL